MISGVQLSNLRYVDVIVLFSNTSDKLPNMIAELHRESLKIALEMNLDKTKITMMMITDNNVMTAIIVGVTTSVPVGKYVYLD